MTNINGPPIRQRVTDLSNGWRLRSSFGDTPNGIQRFDIHDGTGWRDFAWRDKETGEVMHLWDGKPADGKVTMAALGKSQWAGKGPAVPAERGCFECHKEIGTALANDLDFEKLQASLLTQLIALKGDWGRTKPTPSPGVQGPAGPAGPQGPRGLTGEGGEKGLTGKDADNELIIRTLNESMTKTVLAWLNEHKGEFKGADGVTGAAGAAGAAGPAGEKGEPGDAGEINYDVLVTEILKRMPPIMVKSYNQFIGSDGKLIGDPVLTDTELYPAGTPLKIRHLIPVPKPAR